MAWGDDKTTISRRAAARASALLLGAAALAGCGGGVSIYIGDDDFDDRVSVAYTVVDGFDGRALPEGTYVFRDQGELDRAWATGTPQPDGSTSAVAPRFDFGRSTLVAVSFGVGLLCDRPQVVEVSARGDALTVGYRADRDLGASCARTGPLQLFLGVPRWGGPVFFRRFS